MNLFPIFSFFSLGLTLFVCYRLAFFDVTMFLFPDFFCPVQPFFAVLPTVQGNYQYRRPAAIHSF